MSSKDFGYRIAIALILGSWLAAPAFAQTESIQVTPFMTMTAPVQLSGRPIGIEAKYSIGSPELINEPPAKFVHIPAGTRLPVALVSPLDPKAAVMGSAIQARTAENVTLEGGAIIPQGTLVVGHVNSAMGGMEIMFDQMQLSDGTILPISSNVVDGLTDKQAVKVTKKKTFARILTHLSGGVNTTTAQNAQNPMNDAHAHGGCVGLFLKTGGGPIPAGQVMELQLRSPAQVAVNGFVL